MYICVYIIVYARSDRTLYTCINDNAIIIYIKIIYIPFIYAMNIYKCLLACVYVQSQTHTHTCTLALTLDN